MYEDQRKLREILLIYREGRNEEGQKYSLRQLAEKTLLSFSYLSKIERGEVIPPKETVIQISKRLGLSTYQLLISAGYAVNLDKDLDIRDLNWDEEKTKVELSSKYRIMAIPQFKILIEEDKFRYNLNEFFKTMKVSKDEIENILDCKKSVSFIQARNICMYLSLYFYDIFRVKNVSYNIRYLSVSAKDEEVALQLHKLIESYRYSTVVKAENLVKESTHDYKTNKIDLLSIKELKKIEYDFVKIPIYGEIKAGYGMIGEENIIGYEMAAKSKVSDGEYFYLLVKGDSMIDAGISDGALVLIKKQNTVQEGKIGVCIIGDEATLKRVFYDGDKIILQSENRNIKPKTYDLSEVMFQGQAVSVVTEL